MSKGFWTRVLDWFKWSKPPLHREILSTISLLTLLMIFVVYQFRQDLTVNVGDLGDSAFVSGFYADEPDVDYRYRWSKGEAEVQFVGLGSEPIDGVQVVAQGARTGEAISVPVTMSISVNDVTFYPQPEGATAINLLMPQVVTLTQELQTYTFRQPLLPGAFPIRPPFVVKLNTSTFSPAGDGRELGVKVDSVRVTQSGKGINIPSQQVTIWLMMSLIGIAMLTRRWRLLPFAIVVGTAALVLLGLLWANPMFVSAYLPLLAIALGITGLLVWQRKRVRVWPEWVDTVGRGRGATWVMLAAMLVYALVALWTIPQVDWIGHADYAENAVIARNFVQGRGLSVDYAAQFYDFRSIPHPAETWPLLQPLMIAPFFAIFGPQTWAAKLPNLFIMLALAWAIFYVGSRVWEPRVGLLAGLFALTYPYFFNSVLYPINDLGFTALFFVLAWLVWTAVGDEGRKTKDERDTVLAKEAAQSGPQHVGEQPQQRSSFFLRLSSFVRPAMVGGLAGLLIWSKPSGAMLLAGLGLWVGWQWWRVFRPTRRPVPWRSVGVAAGVFAIVLLPLVLRNFLAFGTPFFTTESYDAPILRYWPQVEW